MKEGVQWDFTHLTACFPIAQGTVSLNIIGMNILMTKDILKIRNSYLCIYPICLGCHCQTSCCPSAANSSLWHNHRFQLLILMEVSSSLGLSCWTTVRRYSAYVKFFPSNLLFLFENFKLIYNWHASLWKCIEYTFITCWIDTFVYCRMPAIIGLANISIMAHNYDFFFFVVGNIKI